MNITFTTNPNISLYIPIQLLFWGFVSAYVLHILEESVLGESFVDKVRKNYWPQYDWNKFFGANTFILIVNVLGILAYDIGGGRWIIWPLSLAIERTVNGLYHLLETLITRRFSSGLLSSTLTWILAYLLVRYSLLKGEIASSDFLVSLGIGILLAVLLVGGLFLGKVSGLSKSHKAVP